MRIRWLHKGQQDQAIVIFGGWGVGCAPFEAFPYDRDVLFVEDYRDLDCELPDLSHYNSVDLVAWSFGIAAYGHWQQGRADPFSRKAALCGGFAPVDRKLGIPPLAFKRTVEGLSDGGFQQFLARVYGAEQPKAHPDLDALRQELIAVEKRGPAPEIDFDTVWLAERDQIFPIRNLTRAWESVASRIVDAPHAPFATFTCWEDFWA